MPDCLGVRGSFWTSQGFLAFGRLKRLRGLFPGLKSGRRAEKFWSSRIGSLGLAPKGLGLGTRRGHFRIPAALLICSQVRSSSP